MKSGLFSVPEREPPATDGRASRGREALGPERYSEDHLEQERATLSHRAWSAVKQQRRIVTEAGSGPAQSGRVKLLRGPWNAAFLDEVAQFSLGSHDDQVDAVSLDFAHAVRGSSGPGDFSGWSRRGDDDESDFEEPPPPNAAAAVRLADACFANRPAGWWRLALPRSWGTAT